jgi:hypothetical protein
MRCNADSVFASSSLHFRGNPAPQGRRQTLDPVMIVFKTLAGALSDVIFRRGAARKSLPLLALGMALSCTLQPAAAAERTPAPENAAEYIIWPRDGAVIDGGRFWLRMGLRNMGVAPKGVKMNKVGHHHVLIDTELPPLDQQIPNDRNHLHFGAGETEARIELAPGRHTLQLLLGDADHVPHEPPVYSEKITITVK